MASSSRKLHGLSLRLNVTSSSVAVVVAGCLVLYVAFKIGFVILKIVNGTGGSCVARRRELVVPFRDASLTCLR